MQAILLHAASTIPCMISKAGMKKNSEDQCHRWDILSSKWDILSSKWVIVSSKWDILSSKWG